MTTGTKSLLWGVHQIFWHPLTVWLAWRRLNKTSPSMKEVVCIIVHDWGYFGSEHMDDEIGERHPELGARIAGWLFGDKYRDLCLYHSRHYARNKGREPSKLCWADKYSIHFERWWTYLPRAWLSGELWEYRCSAAGAGWVAKTEPHKVWFAMMQKKLMCLGKAKRADVVEYINKQRNSDNVT